MKWTSFDFIPSTQNPQFDTWNLSIYLSTCEPSVARSYKILHWSPISWYPVFAVWGGEVSLPPVIRTADCRPNAATLRIFASQPQPRLETQEGQSSHTGYGGRDEEEDLLFWTNFRLVKFLQRLYYQHTCIAWQLVIPDMLRYVPKPAVSVTRAALQQSGGCCRQGGVGTRYE